MTRARPSAERLRLARRVSRDVARRAAFHEGGGALRGWRGGDGRSGAHGPLDFPESDGSEAEAARMVGFVDARAEGRGDPDWWE